MLSQKTDNISSCDNIQKICDNATSNNFWLCDIVALL